MSTVHPSSRQQLFFKDSIKDFSNGRREADGCELPWVGCAEVFATGVTIARRQSSGALK